jgi:CRP-like cAMP-binding protein
LRSRPNNYLLRSLSQEQFDKVADGGRMIPLKFDDDLLLPGAQVDRVIFPESGLVSMMVETRDAEVAEGGMIGTEGAVGLMEACGTGVISTRSAVQVAGAGWALRPGDCRTLMDQSADFRRMAWGSAEFQMIETRQSVICRSHHVLEARLSRWLLETLSRSNVTNVLTLTQEFLAAMLGVQRTSVSTAAQELQARGLIRYSRGKIELRDIGGLQRLACDCSKVIISHRNRIFAESS